MGLGSRIQRLRLDRRRTQRSVAAGAGVAAEYLSRLENEHVTPNARTLIKIAKALQVPVSAFFDGEAALETGDRCPVSTSGRCILDHLHAGRGVTANLAVERYSRQQLESLRACDFLVHNGSAEIQRTLATVLKSLLALSDGSSKGPS